MTDEVAKVATLDSDQLDPATVDAMKATGEWMSLRVIAGEWKDDGFVKLTPNPIDDGVAIVVVFERGVMPNHPGLAAEVGAEIGATIGRMLAGQIVHAAGGEPVPEPKVRIAEIRQRRRDDA